MKRIILLILLLLNISLTYNSRECCLSLGSRSLLADEFSDMINNPQALANWCGCTVTVTTGGSSTSTGPGYFSNGNYSGGPMTSTATGISYGDGSTGSGTTTTTYSPQNPSTPPCYTCSCDPFFCPGGNPANTPPTGGSSSDGHIDNDYPNYSGGGYTGGSSSGSTGSGGTGSTTGGSTSTGNNSELGNTGTNNNTEFANSGSIKKFNDEQIKDTKLKPCMQTILTSVKGLSKGSVAQVIAKFSGTAPAWNWEVKDGSLGGATAETSPTYNTTTKTATTTFDSQAFKNATDLSWARTILHESMHAYLTVYFSVDRPNFISSYSQMVQDWGTYQNWNAVHHEEFARSLVTAIADALQEYGAAKGYNLTRQFYEDMSWAGLQDTTTFKNLPAADRTRILDTIAVELTGADTGGNSKTQKGKSAGC